MKDDIFNIIISKIVQENQKAIAPIIADLLDQKLAITQTNGVSNLHPTLDIDGATKLLKVSKQTIYQNIKSIPHRKIFGRLVFLREELLEFIDQNGNTETKNKGDP